MFTNEDIEDALTVLRNGGIILYPTDTIWGVGCDATNPDAVEKIFRLKQRADSKAMLMLVGSEGQLQSYVSTIPEVAWQLIDAAVNPLTIIYDHPRNIAPALLASDGSAGFRITGEKFSSTLCRRLRHPLVSTSANISGKAALCLRVINVMSQVISDSRQARQEWEGRSLEAEVTALERLAAMRGDLAGGLRPDG